MGRYSECDIRLKTEIRKPPADFVARVNGILTPGATLLVTNEALYTQTTGPMVQVVDTDPPAKSQPVHSRGS